MDIHRLLAALGAGLVLTAALAGCSLRVTDAKSTAPGTPTPALTGTPAATTPTPSPSSAPAAKPGGISRNDIIAGAGTTLRCDGELTLMQDAAAVRVEGPCGKLIVNGNGIQVVADDLTALSVLGDANLVFAGSVQQVLVNGNANTIRWSGSTPSVTDTGAANSLSKG